MELSLMDDVIIVGGSFAGLAAALQLGRARRQVTVFDTALPRNRYAEHAHGILGHDGKNPGDILAAARDQLARYETVKIINARATKASGKLDDFTVATEEGEHHGRRLVLAYGLTDEFPPIEGFAECWGKTVLHCPYCHGYEVAEKRWGLIYSTPLSLHATALYGHWTDQITLFSDGHDLPEAEKSKLAKRGVALVEGKVKAFEQKDGRITAVIGEDGTRTELDALYVHPHNRPSADLHDQLGVETDETPTGIAFKVNDRHQTSVEGVYAGGDLAHAMHSVTIASYGGAMAAIGAHQSLVS
jgi:thioredoxin reductase